MNINKTNNTISSAMRRARETLIAISAQDSIRLPQEIVILANVATLRALTYPIVMYDLREADYQRIIQQSKP